MFYIIIFLILSSSVCIYSKKAWENFIDRLDLLIIQSYLIIQCNENEIQIIRFINTFEELESNLKCTNKNDLLEHGNNKVQIIDFHRVTINCENSKFIRINGYFTRIKASLDKTGNGVDWPYVHTPFTKEMGKDPNKLKFYNEKNIDFILREISYKNLSHTKANIFIYLDFVNRPMVCRIRIIGLQKTTNAHGCNDEILDEVHEPICYYKVHGENPPTYEELNEIVTKTRSYVKVITSNYTYISDINHLIDSNNDNKEINSAMKGNKSRQASSKKKNEKKSNPQMIIIILIIAICLIAIIIGIIFFRKKNSLKKEGNILLKHQSDSSDESRISISSNKSENDFPPLVLSKQIQDNKKQSTKRAATNWFKLDEDI